MLQSGIKAVITCVDPAQLGGEFAGRRFDTELLNELPAGVDPCGERGEFHTFVWDGPGFRSPIDVEIGQIVERDGFVFCDLSEPKETTASAAGAG
jgi:diphthamide synthase (EF-2-diphthine--ammonia ligase)